MLADSHVRSGVVGGLAVAVVVGHGLGLVRPADALLFSTVAAGAALLPDVDHPSATVGRAVPPVRWVVVWLHRIVYAATRRRADDRSPFGRSAHRGLSHSVTFAVAVGVMAAWLFVVAPPFVVCAAVVVIALAASDYGYVPLVLVAYVAVGLYDYGPVGLYLHVSSLALTWAVAIVVGMVCHSIGDCATVAGVALLAPLTWRPIRAPLTFRTGGWFERTVVHVVLIGATIYLQFVVNAGWLSALVNAAS